MQKTLLNHVGKITLDDVQEDVDGPLLTKVYDVKPQDLKWLSPLPNTVVRPRTHHKNKMLVAISWKQLEEASRGA